jgi:hypothetical protein
MVRILALWSALPGTPDQLRGRRRAGQGPGRWRVAGRPCRATGRAREQPTWGGIAGNHLAPGPWLAAPINRVAPVINPSCEAMKPDSAINLGAGIGRGAWRET